MNRSREMQNNRRMEEWMHELTDGDVAKSEECETTTEQRNREGFSFTSNSLRDTPRATKHWKEEEACSSFHVSWKGEIMPSCFLFGTLLYLRSGVGILRRGIGQIHNTLLRVRMIINPFIIIHHDNPHIFSTKTGDGNAPCQTMPNEC